MTKIHLDDREKGIYQFYLGQKDNNIARVLKYLFLRDDFYELLDDIYNNYIFRETTNFPGRKIWDYNEPKFTQIIYKYIDNLDKTEYCKQLNKKEKDAFSDTVFHFVHFVYTIHFSNVKNNLHNKDQLVLDNMDNYPTLSHSCFNAESFHNVFAEAFYSIRSINRFEKSNKKHPSHITVCMSASKENEPVVEEKIIQLLIKEGTTKQNLINYIDNNWWDIEGKLQGGRPVIKKTRSKADKNFIRDVDIYNKYQDFISRGLKNPDVKTWSWLKDDSRYRVEVEPNTIAKIVSNINKDIKAINSEK